MLVCVTKISSSHWCTWYTFCSYYPLEWLSNLSPPRTARAYMLRDESKYFTTIIFSCCHSILFYPCKWHFSSSRFPSCKVQWKYFMPENTSSCLLHFIFELPLEVAQFWRMMSTLILSHGKPGLNVGLQGVFSLFSLMLSVVYSYESICRRLTWNPQI